MADLLETMQDDGLVKVDLRNHDRLKTERAPYESLWREVDDRFPNGAGGFTFSSPGMRRGEGNLDTTHITALGRFAAAMSAITVPEEKQYIKPRFADADLMKIRSVALWCEEAGPRMYDMRYSAIAGFGVSAYEDFDQLGRYGTSPVFSDGRPSRGLTFRTLHLAECFIDTDEAGLVDTVHRAIKRTARECEQIFTFDGLTPKMREALVRGKEHEEFELVHFVTPNTQWDADKLDWRRMPVSSRYLALDEKMYLRRAGFHSMPISVSRHLTSAGEKYGRSPAINKMPAIHGVNAMRHTTLRAAHKAVDPALIYYDDDGITSMSTKPGGLNAGLVSESGQPLVARMPGGEAGLPWAENELEHERAEIRAEFLEEFYKILTDPNSRMTTTEVLEVMAKQGILVRPYASRYRTEKQAPMCNRELELARANDQIKPFPPEVLEAGAWPVIDYDNPLSTMAKAEETAKTLRFVQVAGAVNTIAEGPASRIVNVEAVLRGSAEEIGVRPSYLYTAEEVAAKDKADSEAQDALAGVDALATAAGAYKDLAQGAAAA